MRIKVTFKGHSGGFFVPFNYNYALASIIYNKIDDENLHDSHSYKFFTFSNLIFDSYRVIDKGMIVYGSFSVLISSHDSYFIESLISGFCEDFKVIFQGRLLEVVDVEVISNPKFGCEAVFKSLSPILVRSFRRIKRQTQNMGFTSFK